MRSDLVDIPEGEYSLTDSSEPVLSERSAAGKYLLKAMRRLKSIEDLLLNPTPQQIQEAERLFELAAGDIQALRTEPRDWADADEFRADALEFQATSRRVLALLNGAIRVHWHRLRRMGSYHETYTAAGTQKVCVPRLPRLDLKM